MAPTTPHPSPPIHTLAIADVYAQLDSQAQGLTTAEAVARLHRVGANTIHELQPRSLLRKLLTNFTHLMAMLLWVGGVLGFLAGMPELGIAIWIVNLINGGFSFWQEYQAEKATEALRRLLPVYARVRRNGSEERVRAEDLVPGDVILLAEGDHISADGRLVQEADLRVDQSTLTGESHPVRKTAEAVVRTDLSPAELSNLVFAGTSVAAGTGVAVVFATAMRREVGKIAHLTQSVVDTLSPLQQEMQRATKIVTVIAVAVGCLFFLLAVTFTGITVLESFIFALGMIVAFVPEGMVPTVTLALAMGTQRMARRHALVKRLSAVETLGCTTVICTDKTGTLTQNEMTVSELWVAGRPLTVTGIGYAPEGRLFDHTQAIPLPLDGEVRELLVAASLCNDARLLPPNNVSSQWTILGDPTEAALQVVAAKAGINVEREAQRWPRFRELPFDSRRKRMTTVHRGQGTREGVRGSGFGNQGSGVRRQTGNNEALRLKPTSDPRSPTPVPLSVAFIKGAPREVLTRCTQIRRQGQDCLLNETTRSQILRAQDDYARKGLRVLAVAQRVLPETVTSYEPDTVEGDLTFLGLVAMMDPPRVEVTEAVAKCHRAGIRLIMMTGDYGLTAESIARRIGIIRGAQPQLLTGAELATMDDRMLADTIQATLTHDTGLIFARVAPEHKLRVVTALQACGHVVAVTGDGVNDAPALKKADIGIAMGRSGTDVAKEAADMILTDDNFASIVNAVEEGRAVYANIKKFLTYIFTSNMPEAVPFVLFVLSGGRIPLALNVMQILAIDLGTDLVPALALGAEPPEPGVMDTPPRRREDHVITSSLLLRAYPWLGMIQSLAAMAAFYWMYWSNGYWGQWRDLPASGPLYQAATAMTLGSVVATQIGNLFAQRTERVSIVRMGFFGNRLLWVGIATELLLVFAIIYLPPLQRIFGTAALPLHYWLFLFAWTPSLLVAEEIRKRLGD